MSVSSKNAKAIAEALSHGYVVMDGSGKFREGSLSEAIDQMKLTGQTYIRHERLCEFTLRQLEAFDAILNASPPQNKPYFNTFPIGSKVESYDENGQCIHQCCGEIVRHLSDGHAVIKDHDGFYWSSIDYPSVDKIVLIKFQPQ